MWIECGKLRFRTPAARCGAAIPRTVRGMRECPPLDTNDDASVTYNRQSGAPVRRNLDIHRFPLAKVLKSHPAMRPHFRVWRNGGASGRTGRAATARGTECERRDGQGGRAAPDPAGPAGNSGSPRAARSTHRPCRRRYATPDSGAASDPGLPRLPGRGVPLRQRGASPRPCGRAGAVSRRGPRSGARAPRRRPAAGRPSRGP